MAQTFQHKNEGFICDQCGKTVPPAEKTCRNHCCFCLYSKHVDHFPGDRASKCHGAMKPIGVIVKRGEMSDIKFRCEKCGHEGTNKIAPDDNREALLALPIL